MKLQELITKLEQIEQQAALTLYEYPHGLTIERQRLIVALAKQLQSHLKNELKERPGDPAAEQPAERQMFSLDFAKASASS